MAAQSQSQPHSITHVPTHRSPSTIHRSAFAASDIQYPIQSNSFLEESQSRSTAAHPLSNPIIPPSTAARYPLPTRHTESTPVHHNPARPIVLGNAAEQELHCAMLARERRLSNPPRAEELDFHPPHHSGIGSAPPSAFDVKISQNFVSTSSLADHHHHPHHFQSFTMTDDFLPTPTLSSTLDSISESPLFANRPFSFPSPPVAPVGAHVYSPLESNPKHFYPSSYQPPKSTSDGFGASQQFGSAFQRAAPDSLWERQVDDGSYYAGYSDEQGEHNKRGRF